MASFAAPAPAAEAATIPTANAAALANAASGAPGAAPATATPPMPGATPATATPTMPRAAPATAMPTMPGATPATVAAPAPRHAGPDTIGPIAITIPRGFIAAQTQKTKNTWVTAWTKSVRDGSSKTFLQLTVVELGSHAAREGAETVLERELASLGRRRTNYSSSPIAHIQLAGAPAVRATWNGNIGSYPVMGVLYSVIVKGRYVVKILAQDLGTTPTDGLFEAMKAIESIGMS